MSEIAGLAKDMSTAAASFLDGLTTEQRKKVNMPFADETRRNWYYTPTPRPGLPLQEMNPKQQQSFRQLMALGLSEPGYNYAISVMSLEYLVDRDSGFPERTYGDLPGTRVRDPGNYCVAVYGTPGEEDGWSWRVGGHHLNLHYTLKPDFVSPTPAFFGAEPARVQMPGGILFRALAAEEDLARQLLATLNPDQSARAVLSMVPPTDIVQMNRPRIEDGAIYQIGGTGPGGQGLRDKLGLTPEMDELLRYSVAPKGLAAGAMDVSQRELLARLVNVYFEHLAEPIAAQYASLLDAERLNGASFAWAGSDRIRRAALLPHPGRAPPDRVRLHPERRQPHPQRLARSSGRLRRRHPGRPLRHKSRLAASYNRACGGRPPSSPWGAIHRAPTSVAEAFLPRSRTLDGRTYAEEERTKSRARVFLTQPRPLLRMERS